jgi:hypothetical protein
MSLAHVRGWLPFAEATHRAGEECKAEGLTEITTEHLEKILPQLLLDF